MNCKALLVDDNDGEVLVGSIDRIPKYAECLVWTTRHYAADNKPSTLCTPSPMRKIITTLKLNASVMLEVKLFRLQR